MFNAFSFLIKIDLASEGWGSVSCTWKGITRLTVSPTLRMRVWRRFLGSKIFGRSEKQKQSEMETGAARREGCWWWGGGGWGGTTTLTHDLSDGHRLSQRGGRTGPRHVVGTHAELQPVSGGEVPDDQRGPLRQALNGWYPFLCCEENVLLT